MAAEMQNVVYGEYLPTVLGVDYMQRHGLIVEEETRYDDTGPNWRLEILELFYHSIVILINSTYLCKHLQHCTLS